MSDSVLLLLSSLLLALAVSAVLCGWFVRRRHRLWLDQPGERSLHVMPVPRLGGVAICLGMAAGASLAWPIWHSLFEPPLLVAVLLLWGVAVLDDVRSLPASVRFFCQLLAACLAVFGAGIFWHTESMPWLWGVTGLLMYLWGTNLYNFMDGMDGFAGGMAVIGFTALAAMAIVAGDTAFACFCGLVVAANVGFLFFNFPPARLFMGDSGSTVLGFIMVAASLAGWQRELYPAWVPLLIFSPFWVDATITLFRRLLRGEKVWQAHRQHYYQRWVLAGYGHRQVVLVEYVLMLLCTLSALAWQVWAAGYNEVAMFGGWGVAYVLLILGSEAALKR